MFLLLARKSGKHHTMFFQGKLTKCRRIDFSRLQIADDFIVQHENYIPTAFTDLIFVSDVPKAWTWQANELLPVCADEIIHWIRKLECLEVMKARNFLSLTTPRVSSLMTDCRSLKMVDFRDAGVEKNVPWAIKGSKEEVEKVLMELEDVKEL